MDKRYGAWAFGLTAWLAMLISPLAARADDGAIVVAVPAKAGSVDGRQENSDQFMWQQFITVTTPSSVKGKVEFETWASDLDTFAADPKWPAADAPKRLHGSMLENIKNPHLGAIDVPCATPGNAGVGGFPSTGCIAEETRRNRPQFDYIVQNKLYSRAGLKQAFQDPAFTVAMPLSSLAVKVDWVPVATVSQWIPYETVERVRQDYYTTTVNSVEYALVSMHLSSRQNPNWVWATFEHYLTPGRCDFIGCSDTFGAAKAVVAPQRNTVNSQYGYCDKTAALVNMMNARQVAPVWRNYCLKSSEVDYAAADGTPYVLGNSVIEGITGNGTVAASSCIACHAYASFGRDGSPESSVTAMLPFNPIGKPVPGVLAQSRLYDFMWGLLFAK